MDAQEEQKCLALANEFAQPGTVKHFAMRLGFLPHDEAESEAILKSMVEDWEKADTQLAVKEYNAKEGISSLIR